MSRISGISSPEYTIMGQSLTCVEFKVKGCFKLEIDLDHWLHNKAKRAGWKYTKVDTQNQAGFPDALLLKAEKYWTIESKLLKRKKLTNVLTNLRWEPGQIPWMLQALLKKQRHILLVGKDSTVMIIGEKLNVKKIQQHLQA